MIFMVKRIMNTKWLTFLFLLELFHPPYFDQNPVLDTIMAMLKLPLVLGISMMFFIDIKKHLKKPFIFFFLLIWAELFLATIISAEASLYTYAINLMNVFTASFFVAELAVHSPYNGLKSLYVYFSLCVLINTATVFLFPGAMYANNRGLWVCWFLGEDNGAYVYYIMASAIAMLYCYYITQRTTLLSLLVWACSFIFVFHNDIATGIVCQVIWLLLVLGYRFKWFSKLLNARYALYITAGGFVFLVVTRSIIFEPIFALLNRRITLSGRTDLWDKVLAGLAQRPILGFGMCSGEQFDSFFLKSGLLNAHNWLLMLAFYGGAVAVFLFGILFFVSCWEAQACRDTKYYRCIVIGLIVLSVRFLVEAGGITNYFMFLTLLAYSKEFVQNATRLPAPKSVKIRFGSVPYQKNVVKGDIKL